MSDERFRALLPRLSCASLVDAMAARYSHRAHILDLVSPKRGSVLFGQAVTIAYIPTRTDIRDRVDNDFASLFYRAIKSGGAGKVLVMAGGGHRDAAYGGGRKLSRLRHTGLAGAMVDGRLRDLDTLADYAFVTYCRGETVCQGGGLVMPHAVNVPVQFQGVGVLPGDYIYVDSSGAVVMPEADIADILTDATNRHTRDQISADRMRHEDPEKVISEGEAR